MKTTSMLSWTKKVNKVICGALDIKCISIAYSMMNMQYSDGSYGTTITLYVHDNRDVNNKCIVFNNTLSEYKTEKENRKVFNEFEKTVQQLVNVL